MKFGRRLEQEAVAEWASKYINYKLLKKLIQKIPPRVSYQSLEELSPDENQNVDDLSTNPATTPLSSEEKEFLSNLNSELQKVENFYFEQLKDGQLRKELIVKQIEKLREIVRKEHLQKLSKEQRRPFSRKGFSIFDPQRRVKSNLNTKESYSRSKDDLALLDHQVKQESVENPLVRGRFHSWSEGSTHAKHSDDFFIGSSHMKSPTASADAEEFHETITPFDESKDLVTATLKEQELLLPQRVVSSSKADDSLKRKNDKFGAMNKQEISSKIRFDIRKAILQNAALNSNLLAKRNIRKALIELYRSLELLKEYRDLNILAYIKIVKKFEKNTARGLKESLLNEFMLTPFYRSTELPSLFEQVEDLYQRHYTNDNRHLAMKALRTLGFESIQAKENAHDNLFVGLFTGINIMFLVTIYKFALNHSSHPDEYKGLSDEVNGLLLMYFGFGFPLLISNLIIINMYVWDRYKINYRLVCGVSPRTSTSQYAVFVSFLFLVYLSYVYISVTGQLDGVLLPISQVWVLLILMLTIVANSFKYYQSSRIWLGVLIWRIVSAPLYTCIFKDFFVADQLVSMSPFYQSVGLLLYATFTRSSSATYAVLKSGSLPFTWYIALFPMIPFFWRAMQCLRRFSDGLKKQAGYTQLINCSRYSLAILVLVLNTFHSAFPQNKSWVYLAILFRVVYSIFSYYWDINMDWGLGNGRMMAESHVITPGSTSKTKEKMIVYPAWVYYFVIATDGLTRFIWLPFSILSLYAIKVPTAGYYLAVIELLRRFQWNFVRVEIEHVHNCEKLQVTEDVDLPFRTQDLFVDSPEDSSKMQEITIEGDLNTIDDELLDERMRNRNDGKMERMKHIWQPLSQMLAVAAPSISDKLRAFLKPDSLSRVSSAPHELEVHAQNSSNSIVKDEVQSTCFPTWIEEQIQIVFKTKKRNTTIEREIYAGLIQFLESFYILAVIPFQLNGAGYDSRVAVIGTCTACCVGCIVSGLFTDLPFMLAPSVAVSIFFAVSMERANLTPDNGSASLIISGFMLCLLGVLPPVDRFLTGIIPDAIQAAVSIGLGLITSLAGLTNIDLIVRGKNTLSDMGEISVEVVVTFSILVIIAVLFTFKQKGGFSLCLVGGSVVWWIITSTWPRAVVLAPTAASDSGNVHDENVILLIFNLFFLYILILNSLARPLGALSQLLKKSGELPRGNILFIICGLSTMLSGYLGGPPILLSAESVVGIQAGGRTGLSTCICGVCFGIAIFFFPLFASVPACAVSAILIMVGVIMFGNSTRIRWNDYHAAVPAFCVTCLICFTYSILRGVAFGYGLYIMINLYTGKLFENISKIFKIYQTIKRNSITISPQAQPSSSSFGNNYTTSATNNNNKSMKRVISDNSFNNDEKNPSKFRKAVRTFHRVLDEKFTLKQSNIEEFIQL